MIVGGLTGGCPQTPIVGGLTKQLMRPNIYLYLYTLFFLYQFINFESNYLLGGELVYPPNYALTILEIRVDK